MGWGLIRRTICGGREGGWWGMEIFGITQSTSVSSLELNCIRTSRHWTEAVSIHAHEQINLSNSLAFYFFLNVGAMSTMPAVRVFSLYAAIAVIFDFLLQITAFVAILSLDTKRQENNRLDLFCCIKEPKKNSSGDISCNMYMVMKYFAEVLLSDIVRPIVVSKIIGKEFSSKFQIIYIHSKLLLLLFFFFCKMNFNLLGSLYKGIFFLQK